jgi:hypothetical protein
MSWLRRLFHKSRAEKELDAELRFHLEQQGAALSYSYLGYQSALSRLYGALQTRHLRRIFNNLSGMGSDGIGWSRPENNAIHNAIFPTVSRSIGNSSSPR